MQHGRHLAFTGLRAEAPPDFLRRRPGRADDRGQAVVRAPDRVQVLFEGVAGLGLDQRQSAVRGQGLPDAASRPDRVAHVVQGVEQAHQVAALAGVFTQIKNVGSGLGSGLCLQPVAPVVSSPVVQEPCVPQNDPNASLQGWTTMDIGGHTGFLNQASGLCLFAFIGAQNGAPIGLNTCRLVSTEEFDTNSSPPGGNVSPPAVVEIESRIGFTGTGFCLDVPGGAATPGLQIQLYSRDATLAQRWIVGFALS